MTNFGDLDAMDDDDWDKVNSPCVAAVGASADNS